MRINQKYKKLYNILFNKLVDCGNNIYFDIENENFHQIKHNFNTSHGVLECVLLFPKLKIQIFLEIKGEYKHDQMILLINKIYLGDINGDLRYTTNSSLVQKSEYIDFEPQIVKNIYKFLNLSNK